MILDDISKEKIKQLDIKELQELANEVRQEIIEIVEKNGGHLSPSLGTVELIIALLYVFDIDKDKIIFDVGHQAYAYKILSGRHKEMSTIRKEGGLSGFPDSNESKYDAFSVGHAGTSISAGLGYAMARDTLKEDYFVINIVGDASFFNGENLEAISLSNVKPKKFIVVLNDNGMSINRNENGLYKLVSKITTTKKYYKFNGFLSKTIGNCFIGKFLKKVKRGIKRVLTPNTIADSIGIKYVGIFDGNDVKTLINILTNIKEGGEPVFLHIKTVKGKGLQIAENNATKYHGIGKNLEVSNNTFSLKVSDILKNIIKTYPNIMAITPAMKVGSGLEEFASGYKDNFLDVGIAEESAITIAGGMAKGGIKPIVFIYSTFLQRGYDQLVHDICLQNLPVVFCIDRAGVVGQDGKTHQGVFDISYLRHIPNMTIFAPKDTKEFEQMMNVALSLNSPVSIRYPNGYQKEFEVVEKIDNGLKWEVFDKGKDVTILAVGGRMLDLAISVKNSTTKPINIVNARVVSPLDTKLLDDISSNLIITLEDNAIKGGFGESVLSYYNSKNINKNIKIFGIKDKFVEHATIQSQLKSNGISVEDILKVIN